MMIDISDKWKLCYLNSNGQMQVLADAKLAQVCNTLLTDTVVLPDEKGNQQYFLIDENGASMLITRRGQEFNITTAAERTPLECINHTHEALFAAGGTRTLEVLATIPRMSPERFKRKYGIEQP
jgi:hypothetical protein